MVCQHCQEEIEDGSIFCSLCGKQLLSESPVQDSGAAAQSTKGRVLAFDWKAASGVISGDDGYRYDFQTNDWIPDRPPSVGAIVDFVIDGNNAREIYPSSGAVASQGLFSGDESKKLAAGLLGLIFGFLGVHKFYLGYKREGIIMLVVFIAGWVIILPALAVAIIAIVEGVIYLTKSDEEFNQIYVEGRKPWF